MEKNDPQDEYLKWKDKEKSTFTKFSRNVNPLFIIIGFFIIVGLSYLVTSKQVSSGVMFVFIACFVVLIFIFISREKNELKLLPEQVCKQIAYNAMETKRKEGREIPSDARIRIVPLSGACYEQDMITGTSGIVKREVGVEVIIKNRLRKSYIVGINPYSGIVLDILPQQFGLGNKDVLKKDVKIIPVQFLDNNK